MDTDDFGQKPSLKLVEGKIDTELVPAGEIATELQTKVIAPLHVEKQTLEQTQVSLGLRRDPTDIYRRRYVYPKPLDAEKAMSQAVDRVGGDYFVQDRKLVDRLEDVEEKTIRSLEYLKQETRGFSRFKPNQIKRRHYLTKELTKQRKSLNEALTRYNNRVAVLNRPENQEKIRNVAESLLKEDVKLQVKRIELDRQLGHVSQTLERSYKLEKNFGELKQEKVLIRRDEITIGEKTLSLPSPANQRSFNQQLSKAKEKNLALTKALSK